MNSIAVGSTRLRHDFWMCDTHGKDHDRIVRARRKRYALSVLLLLAYFPFLYLCGMAVRAMGFNGDSVSLDEDTALYMFVAFMAVSFGFVIYPAVSGSLMMNPAKKKGEFVDPKFSQTRDWD